MIYDQANMFVIGDLIKYFWFWFSVGDKILQFHFICLCLWGTHFELILGIPKMHGWHMVSGLSLHKKWVQANMNKQVALCLLVPCLCGFSSGYWAFPTPVCPALSSTHLHIATSSLCLLSWEFYYLRAKSVNTSMKMSEQILVSQFITLSREKYLHF